MADLEEIVERVIRLEERHDAALKALEHQAREYERRLEQLNHAHLKHEAFAATFVSEDIFAAYRDSVATEFKQINKFVSELRGSTSGKTSTRHLVFEIITILIAAIAVIAAIVASSG